MRKLALTMVMTAAYTMPAQAAIVLADNFDAEGTTVLNYTAFDNFTVSGGSVDLLRNYPGIACASGSCVDLDGSTGQGGTLTTKNSYGFKAGDVITLSFVLAGNQRGGADGFSFGFNTTASTSFQNVVVGGALAPGLVSLGDLGSGVLLSNGRPNGILGEVASGEAYTPYSISFRAGNAGTLTAFVGTNSADNIGPVLDNFMLDISKNAIPEPASWAMMIGGFGILGVAMRRRRARAKLSCA